MSAPALEAEFRSDEQIANDFLGYLQSESSDRVAYEVEPSRLSGGFDARLYRYKLVGQQPRVLRVLRSNREVEELVYCQFVYKQLKQRGLKVPAIHSTCGDKSVLGGVFCGHGFDLWTASESRAVSKYSCQGFGRVDGPHARAGCRTFYRCISPGWDPGGCFSIPSFGGKLVGPWRKVLALGI